jgi:hypothetical protein
MELIESMAKRTQNIAESVQINYLLKHTKKKEIYVRVCSVPILYAL